MTTKILLIDDEEDILEGLSSELRSYGYLVFTASNGREGLEVSRREIPHLIFLDIKMPQMDGWQVLRALKEDEATNKIPVIMLTALGQTNFIFESQRLQASDYLIKPFGIEEVLKLIRRYAWSAA